MNIEWKVRRPAETPIHVASLAPFPVELHVWRETEDDRWFATIELPFLRGPFYAVKADGVGFASEQEAKDGAVKALQERMERIAKAFLDGLIFQ